MKTNTKNTTNHGFTLIEMVGVLAVIAILAALLVPKIFAAINDSRFSSSISTINSCKTATMDYFGKAGNFPAVGTADFDSVLVRSNCLERPLACRLAETGAHMQVTNVALCAGAAKDYLLDGATSLPTTAGQVVECVLNGVARADAYELSRRIDGDTLSVSTIANADTLGRVVYEATTDPVDVYIYIAHK